MSALVNKAIRLHKAVGRQETTYNIPVWGDEISAEFREEWQKAGVAIDKPYLTNSKTKKLSKSASGLPSRAEFGRETPGSALFIIMTLASPVTGCYSIAHLANSGSLPIIPVVAFVLSTALLFLLGGNNKSRRKN